MAKFKKHNKKNYKIKENKGIINLQITKNWKNVD